jgi:hypothetical protein
METFVGLPDWTCRSLKQCRHPEPGGDAYLRGQSRIGTPSIWISCRLRQSGSGKARKVGSPPSGRLAQQSLGGARSFHPKQGHSPSRASRSALHWRVANLERRGHIEAIETGPQASALGAELTNLDPIAFRNISGQRKGAGHAVGGIAGRTKQRVIAHRGGSGRPVGTQQACRKAKARRTSIRQAAIDAIGYIQRVAITRHLHDHKYAISHQDPAWFGHRRGGLAGSGL